MHIHRIPSRRFIRIIKRLEGIRCVCIVNNNGEILSGLYTLRTSMDSCDTFERAPYRIHRNIERARGQRSGQGIFEREFSREMYRELLVFECERATPFVRMEWSCTSKRERNDVLNRESEVTSTFFVIEIRDDCAWIFSRTHEFSSYLELRIRVRLKRTM